MPETILVTGFPSFVARKMVEELAREPDTTIYCVVRQKSLEEARSVLDVLPLDQRRRILVLEGDAAAIDLGLSGAELAAMTPKIDFIHHLAQVSYMGAEEKLATHVNVGGAREKWLGVVTKTPSAIPHIVFAVGVLVAFGFAPFHLNGSWLILFLCYLAVFMPQASIAAESAVQQVGGQLVEASRIFGARPARTFLTVQLPLILPGLAAGWALIFTLIVGELNSAAILAEL